jgi:siroheme synthase-like protein
VSGLPILVEGSALTVLVVGGGAVAVRKATALAGAGATVRVVAREASAAMRELAQGGRISLEERAYVPADMGDSMLVVAATNDRSVNATIAAQARATRRLVNVADAPDEGSFATMATHRAGSLVIGVSAGGVPGAAARVRDALAARFDQRYAGALSDLVTLRRSLLARGQGARWRSLSSEVIDDRFCDAVEEGALGERMASWR